MFSSETVKDESFGKSLDIAAGKSHTDSSCKEVMTNKYFLAKILQSVCTEYKNLTLEEIVRLIEGEPECGAFPVDKELTGQKIHGMANEDSSNYEGTVRYDVRFQAAYPTPSGKYEKLIINIEAQGNFNPGYSLITRGIYYVSRMISAQNGTEFEKSNYNEIKKVYSIWICLNPNKEWQGSVNSYTIHENNISGTVLAKPKVYDKINVTMIGLKNEYDGSDGIVDFLSVIFSTTLSAEEKKSILKEKFGIDTKCTGLERGIANMFNYGEYVYSQGLAKGRAEGVEALISTLKEMGVTPAAIIAKVAEKFGMTEDEARKEYEKYA